jgi:hypothetical protein
MIIFIHNDNLMMTIAIGDNKSRGRSYFCTRLIYEKRHHSRFGWMNVVEVEVICDLCGYSC